MEIVAHICVEVLVIVPAVVSGLYRCIIIQYKFTYVLCGALHPAGYLTLGFRCGEVFSFEHLLSCPALGIDLRPQISALKEAQAWDKFAFLVIGRFQIFIHCHRGGQCERDEEILFETLNELCLV